jgi:DNA polymerase-3 subunit epsilon
MIPLVAFDLETHSKWPLEARIVTAAIVVLDENGVPLIESSYLVDPGVDIPEEATKIHGITTEHAREHGLAAPLGIAAIVAELRTWQVEQQLPVAIYNAAYDLTVLDQELRRHNLGHLGPDGVWDPHPVIDPFVLDRYVDRYRKGSRNLHTVATYHRAEIHGDAHEATGDAITAGRLAQVLLGYRKFDGVTPTMLHEAEIRYAAAVGAHWSDFFHTVGEHERGAAAQNPWPWYGA